MGPPRPPTEGGRREQPFMPHNDGRTDGRMSDVEMRTERARTPRTTGHSPFRSLPRGLVGSGQRARGAHMPPHSPPTDHKMTRDSRWIQLTKRTTQEDAGRIIEFPRRYLTKRKVNGLRARDSSHFRLVEYKYELLENVFFLRRYQLWSIHTQVWSLLPHTAKAFEKAGIYGTWRTAIEATSQICPTRILQTGVGNWEDETADKLCNHDHPQQRPASLHADRCAPWHQKAVVNAVCYILQEQLSLPSLPLLYLRSYIQFYPILPRCKITHSACLPHPRRGHILAKQCH